MPTASCSTPQAQEKCCEPTDGAACCGTSAAGARCGCATGHAPATDVRDTVRAKYAAAARQASWCCEPEFDPADTWTQTFGAMLYGDEGAHAPEPAVKASLGCGLPTAVADLHEGEIVLDLGSGAGADVLISAKRAPAGASPAR